jgi:pimeloyl-ACP methyl ester carboxylesterase
MHTVLSRDGTPIAFDRLGEGPPVILMGGAFSYRAFPKMVELGRLLADGFTVVNYDRRGRGDSGDSAPYAVEREIEDLEALIAAVGPPASVWGWSSGGVLALRAAASGLEIDRIAVYEPPFMVKASHRLPPADFGARLDELVAADRRRDAVRYYMREGMGIPGIVVALMRFAPFWSKLEATAHTLPYDWAVMGDTMTGRPLSADEWSSVQVRTLVLAGEKTPVPLFAAAEALAGVLPDARHYVLPRQSHNVSMPALAPVLKEFFAERDPATPAAEAA